MALLEDDARDFDARIDADLKLALEAARRRKTGGGQTQSASPDLLPSEEGGT